MAVNVINALAVDVIWQPAIGKVSGYRIKYFTKEDDVMLMDVAVDKQHAVITNLTPGETYTFCVVSMSERVESYEAPPGGISTTLRKCMIITDALVTNKIHYQMEIFITKPRSYNPWISSQV